MVGHWNKLPREAVAASSLSEFRKHLDNTQTWGLNFGWSSVEPGVGFCDPCGSLPSKNIPESDK